jgi:hypothetical protein
MIIEPSQLEKESSLEYWWPVVVELKIPAPKTTIVHLSKRELTALHSEKIPKSVVRKVKKAAEQYGYPFFLRTDCASGKHSWKESCYVPKDDELWTHVYEVVVFNLTADIFGLPFRCLVVREYIPLEAKFTAFWGEMPVAKERRYFVRDGKVECHHEYWVEGAIRQGMQGRDIPESEWLPQWQDLNRQDDDEITLLTGYTKAIGKELAGYWSVDFAKAQDGRWLLIDMGRGEISYHKEDCPNHQTEEAIS